MTVLELAESTSRVDSHSFVTLIFDPSIAHEKTDDLMHLLEKMKLTEVIVETP
jgi:hypothetical protein